MLAGKLDDIRRIPHDVVLTDSLEPKDCIPSDRRPTSEFQMKKPGAATAVDFYPASWINQEAEHVLFSTVQSCSSIERRLRRLKIRCHVSNNFQQFGIPETRVGHAMKE